MRFLVMYSFEKGTPLHPIPTLRVMLGADPEAEKLKVKLPSGVGSTTFYLAVEAKLS